MEKTIQINPDFLQASKKRYKKKKGANREHSLKANDIKKKLLEKIKEHQIKSQETSKKKIESEKKKKSTDDEFKMSLNYLNAVSKEKKEKKKKRKKERNAAKTRPINKNNIKDDPPYGVLKGGKKPLYRDYMKTMKKNPEIEEKNERKITIHNKDNINPDETERQKKLRKFRKKIRKRNFTIGKDLKRRRVAVLIKNKTVKKIIEEKKRELKGKHLHAVKKKLRKRGLIRVGTPAPEDVIRKMFEDAEAAGDVYNRSPEVLLYNYLNEKK